MSLSSNIQVFRTMVVPAALAPLANQLAEGLAGSAGSSMWTTALAPTDSTVISHYISTGLIEAPFADLLADPTGIYLACQQAGISVPLETIQNLISSSDISAEDPFEVMARMGLSMLPPTENE